MIQGWYGDSTVRSVAPVASCVHAAIAAGLPYPHHSRWVASPHTHLQAAKGKTEDMFWKLNVHIQNLNKWSQGHTRQGRLEHVVLPLVSVCQAPNQGLYYHRKEWEQTLWRQTEASAIFTEKVCLSSLTHCLFKKKKTHSNVTCSFNFSLLPTIRKCKNSG